MRSLPAAHPTSCPPCIYGKLSLCKVATQILRLASSVWNRIFLSQGKWNLKMSHGSFIYGEFCMKFSENAHQVVDKGPLMVTAWLPGYVLGFNLGPSFSETNKSTLCSSFLNLQLEATVGQKYHIYTVVSHLDCPLSHAGEKNIYSWAETWSIK